MTKTLFLVPAVHRSSLSRVWIETGNPKQPLASVWIDNAVRIAAPGVDREPRTEPVPACRGLRLVCA
ncbi:MAG: hypothetical protein WBG54_22880 [Acidobacteriaceae bacterium]